MSVPQRATSALALAAAGLLAFGGGVASAANNPGTGDSGFFTFRPSATIGGTQINVASGNALVRTRDLADSLLNYHVVVDRAYNSLAPDTFSILSPRWAYDVGPATGLTVESNQDVTVTGPSGYRIRFARQANGSYDPPDGFDGSLTKTPNGWTLVRTSQGDEFGFDNSGTLTWTKDAVARDFTVQGTSAAGRTVLSSYGTSSGRRVNVSYTGDSLVREMDDPSSGHHYYRYAAGRLTAYESPSGQITSYHYDSDGLLDKITEPGGTTVELDVAASGRVRSISTTLPGGFPQTTSFVYTRRTYKSDAIAPDGVRRTYAYDDDWRVTRQYNPDEMPSVTASAELRDLAGGYVGPNRTYPVTVAATQPDGAGLRRLWLTLVPEHELAGKDVPCTTTPFDLVCPQTHDVPLDIDFSPLPEGPTTIRGAARDDEQNRGNSAAWEVTVDKTAPVEVAASGELFDAHDGYINGQGTKTLTASAVDPDMANGTRLSGIRSLQLEDVGHGIVATTNVSCTALACPVTASETLDVDTGPLAEGAHQLRIVTTDLVGNVSRSDSWTVNVDKTPPTSPGLSSVVGGRFANGEAEITWEPGVDPPLADGSDPSGETTTLIRTRAPGGAWSDWTETNELTHGLPAGTPATVEVELRTADAVGNVGPVTSGTVTFDPDETDTCDERNAPGPALECEVLNDAPAFDSEDDPDIDLERDDIFDDGAAGRATNPALRYWVTSDSVSCEHDPCWTTTRYFPQSFTTGNMRMQWRPQLDRVHNGTAAASTLDKRARFWRTYLDVPAGSTPKNYFGHNGTSDACVWLARGNLAGAGVANSSAPCSSKPETQINRYGNYIQRRARPTAGAEDGELRSVPKGEPPVWVNCFWDGDDHDEPARLMRKVYWGQYHGHQYCNPSSIRLKMPTDAALKAQMADQPLAFCANVFTNPKAPHSARLQCRPEDRVHPAIVQRLKDNEGVSNYLGERVGWRYVVRGRRWVMVAVPGFTGAQIHWVFVPRYLFPKDVADWPGTGAKPAGLSYG